MSRRFLLFTTSQWIGIAGLLLAAIAVWWLVSLRPSADAPQPAVIGDSLRVDTVPLALQRDARFRRYDSIHTARRDSIHRLHLLRRDSLRRSDSLFWANSHSNDSLFWDSVYRADSIAGRRPPRHIKRDTVLELNSADTTQLMLIRGIGSSTARKIVSYRRKLGGFVSVSQLRDPELGLRYPLHDSVLLSFVVSTDSVVRYDVNRITANRIVNHPYCSYPQAKALEDLRHKRTIRSLNDLRSLECFTDSSLLRLAPYLIFPAP